MLTHIRDQYLASWKPRRRIYSDVGNDEQIHLQLTLAVEYVARFGLVKHGLKSSYINYNIERLTIGSQL